MRNKTKHNARFRMGVVAAMAVGLIVGPAGAAIASDDFTDVPDDHAFHFEIGWLNDEGISTGWENDEGREYRPKQNISREAMAAFLYRFDDTTSDADADQGPCPDSGSGSGFVDVDDDHPFCQEIAWLADEGISTGWDAGGGEREYRPKDDISREAMAAFLERHAGDHGVAACGGDNESGFEDVDNDHTFCDEIRWLGESDPAISRGWNVGTDSEGEDLFEYRPKNNITREAMAAFLYRYNADGGGLEFQAASLVVVGGTDGTLTFTYEPTGDNELDCRTVHAADYEVTGVEDAGGLTVTSCSGNDVELTVDDATDDGTPEVGLTEDAHVADYAGNEQPLTDTVQES